MRKQVVQLALSLFTMSAIIVLTLITPCYASSVQEDITAHPNCPFCGMDRAKFDYSRMLVEYDDGTSFGACSIHCAAMDMALHLDKSVQTVKVGDYQTKQLIDAETATWVIGGDKPGVMTMRAKWAFADEAKAEAFVKDHGGQLGSFDDAMNATFEDMYKDTKMIREKRKMMKKKAS